jgi:short-subunit dehydrogenase
MMRKWAMMLTSNVWRNFSSGIPSGEMVDYACAKSGALAFQEGLRQELKYWYKAPNVRPKRVNDTSYC